MGVYLSVDLDYWRGHKSPNSSNYFFNKVFDLNVPITFVIEHEELLSDIKKMKDLTSLYNIDYHSDIIGRRDINDIPEDYDWANFVPGRSKAQFVWCMPKNECYLNDLGTCHADGDDPFRPQKNSGWKNCQMMTGLRMIPWDYIDRVGICLSPCFVNLVSVNPTIERLGLSVKKARKLVEKQPYEAHKRQRGILKEIAA